MEKYEQLIIEIVEFRDQDVITDSGDERWDEVDG